MRPGLSRRLSCSGAAAETGNAGLVTVLATVALLTAAGAGLVAAGDLAWTAARARSAADAAALAGMATSPLVTPLPETSPQEAARTVATANGAAVVRSDLRGWPLRYRVTVRVEPALGWVRRALGQVTARAAAGVRPRTPTSGRKGV